MNQPDHWGRPDPGPAGPDHGRAADRDHDHQRRHVHMLVHIPDRNWWEIFLLWLCAMTGSSVLMAPQLLDKFQRALPTALLLYWGFSLLTGGTIALVGALWRRSWLALLIERVGLLFLAGACLAYPIGVGLSAGAAGLPRVVPVALFAAVVLKRIYKITLWLRAGMRAAP